MLDHVSDQTVRLCLEALVQLNQEGDADGILSFVGILDEMAENPRAAPRRETDALLRGGSAQV